MNSDDSKNPNAPNGPNENLRTCEAFAEDLSHFVLDELDDARRPALEQHLTTCAACRAERDLLVRSIERLKTDAQPAPILELSADRRAELLNQAAASTSAATVTRHRWNLPRVAAAAAVVAAAGLAWTYWWKQQKTCDDGPVSSDGLLAARRSSYRGSADAAPPLSDREEISRVGYVGGSDDADELLDGSIEGVPQPTAAAPTTADDSRVALWAHPGVPKKDEHVFAIDELAQEQGIGTPRSDSPPPGDQAPESDGTGVRLSGLHLTPEQMRVMTKQKSNEALTSEETKVLREARRQAREAKTTNGAGVAKSRPSGGRLATGGGSAKPAESAPAKGEAELTESEIDALRSLGCPSGDAGSGEDAQGAQKTSSLNSEELRRLEELGYIKLDESGRYVSLCPDDLHVDSVAAPTAGVFVPDNADASIKGSTENFFSNPIEPASLARSLAESVAPSELVALQPALLATLGFDPSKPMDVDSGRHTDDLIREFLKQLSPRQGETPRDMFFRYFGDHPFVSTRIDRMSTFGMDVDTASYNLVRAYLTQGNLPPKAAVRTEEFVNAFRHDLAPPDADGAEVFAIHTELAPSPFGDGNHVMLQVGLKAREIPKSRRRPVALTFVIDVSGSMEEGGRLELVKRSLMQLVDQLDERDTIGIVTFSTDAKRVLDPTNAARRAMIGSTLDRLRPDGSTNADAGLRLGYDMALEQLRSSAENRVILCSDGVANTGMTDPNGLVQRIRECKTKYLYLNCIGVGMNNHNDALLEQLADEGDGFCAYVDRDEEAKEIFVDKLSGTLITVARNAKIQVEFDDHSVRRFRQLGYENRALAHRDFRNDRVDAGEVGAGHEVIALYELELQEGAPHQSFPLATVRCRYEEPHSGEVIEQARPVFVAEQRARVSDATPRFRLSMAVAEFAEILRQSIHARAGSLADVQRFAEPLVAELPGDDDVPEFVALVKQAARLPDLLPKRTELVRAVDEIKRFRCLREEVQRSDAAKDAANDELMRQMEVQNRRLEQALRDALERAGR